MHHVHWSLWTSGIIPADDKAIRGLLRGIYLHLFETTRRTGMWLIEHWLDGSILTRCLAYDWATLKLCITTQIVALAHQYGPYRPEANIQPIDYFFCTRWTALGPVFITREESAAVAWNFKLTRLLSLHYQQPHDRRICDQSCLLLRTAVQKWNFVGKFFIETRVTKGRVGSFGDYELFVQNTAYLKICGTDLRKCKNFELRYRWVKIDTAPSSV